MVIHTEQFAWNSYYCGNSITRTTAFEVDHPFGRDFPTPYLARVVVVDLRIYLIVADEFRVVGLHGALFHANAVSRGQVVDVVSLLGGTRIVQSRGRNHESMLRLSPPKRACGTVVVVFLRSTASNHCARPSVGFHLAGFQRLEHWGRGTGAGMEANTVVY